MRLMIAATAACAGVFAGIAAAGEAAPGAATVERLVLEAARAEQYADMRFAFAVDFEQIQNGQRAAFTARYDPRREDGAHWTLEGASLEELDEHTRKTFENLQASHRGDDGIVYDRLGENLTEENLDRLELRSETPAEAVFAAPLVGDDAPEGVLELVITFDKARDYVSRLDLRMVEPFKPNAMVKMKSMDQSQHFAPPASEGAPALLALSENVMTGNAMFRKFSSDTRLVYSEIEPVDVPLTDDAGDGAAGEGG